MHFISKNKNNSINIQSFLKHFSINKEINYEFRDSQGRNFAHLSIINEDLAMFRDILTNKIELFSMIDNENHTPLSLSIKESKYFASKILINNKIDVNKGGGTCGSCLAMSVVKL